MTMTLTQCPECEREWIDGQRSCPCGYGRKDAQKSVDAFARSTYHKQEYGCTKEEFGLKLYDTIFIIGRLLTVRMQRAHAVHHQENIRLSQLDNEHHQLTKELASQMLKLKPSEVTQVVQHYPWCAHI